MREIGGEEKDSPEKKKRMKIIIKTTHQQSTSNSSHVLHQKNSCDKSPETIAIECEAADKPGGKLLRRKGILATREKQ